MEWIVLYHHTIKILGLPDSLVLLVNYNLDFDLSYMTFTFKLLNNIICLLNVSDNLPVISPFGVPKKAHLFWS